MLTKIYNHVVDPKIQLVASALAARKHGLATFQVAGNNMMPTLLLNEVAWFSPMQDSFTLQREQVLAVSLEEFGNTIIPYRLIGLPGDQVQLCKGELLINNECIPQPYLNSENAEEGYSRNTKCVHIPSNYVWLLGDFRDLSKDSRSIGPVPLQAIVGQVVKAHPLGEHANPRSVI
ncbi:MAG TPA: signal peptidase I [Thiobacillaceae bacterium]|nr:signal peptidase I [Thiobacillaceae bacterium]